MENKRTFNNQVLIKLDPENKTIQTKSGLILYVDDTFEMEKNITVSGVVYGLPSHLSYCGEPNKDMPWETPLELKYGDKVIVYYLSVVNALKPEHHRYFIEGVDRYVLISYQSIFCTYGDDWVKPINGYVFVEPSEDPVILTEKDRMRKAGLELVVLKTQSNTNVSYGKVKYLGIPNRRYVDSEYTDEGVDIAIGDIVVLKKVNDIPVQYNLHQRINNGELLWRVQRKNILAKL
jgi:hypothetical protein